VWRDGKESEICTAGLEFESGRAPLVRAWDSRGFTHSPEPNKIRFSKNKVYSNKKTKKLKTNYSIISFLFLLRIFPFILSHLHCPPRLTHALSLFQVTL